MAKGFSTLLIIIALGSVALGLSLWIATSSLWSIRASSNNKFSAQAKMLANACAELALQTVRENASYVGSGDLAIAGGACTFKVENFGGSNRLITVSGTAGLIVRKIKIIVNNINPRITLSSWQEVADF